ncbi:GNAT family N-acetyltransferase [Micromonospora sp. NPDC094482]|uniref:GNAT family N-acetyltransferase n=1 Tax=Micromonospora sp. NPDC094482 TaxID=3155081 RepID=UPI0033308E78
MPRHRCRGTARAGPGGDDARIEDLWCSHLKCLHDAFETALQHAARRVKGAVAAVRAPREREFRWAWDALPRRAPTPLARVPTSPPRVIHDHDDALATIARWRGREEGMHGVWAVEDRHSGQPLGTLLLVGILASSGREPLPPTGETEIGWYFHPHAWGHGYAGEAARTVLQCAFDAGPQTVLAVTHPDNTASQALCRGLGMEHRAGRAAHRTRERHRRTVGFVCYARELPRPTPGVWCLEKDLGVLVDWG